MSGEFDPHYIHREDAGPANIFKKGARNIRKQYYCTNCIDAGEDVQARRSTGGTRYE